MAARPLAGLPDWDHHRYHGSSTGVAVPTGISSHGLHAGLGRLWVPSLDAFPNLPPPHPPGCSMAELGREGGHLTGLIPLPAQRRESHRDEPVRADPALRPGQGRRQSAEESQELHPGLG